MHCSTSLTAVNTKVFYWTEVEAVLFLSSVSWCLIGRGAKKRQRQLKPTRRETCTYTCEYVHILYFVHACVLAFCVSNFMCVFHILHTHWPTQEIMAAQCWMNADSVGKSQTDHMFHCFLLHGLIVFSGSSHGHGWPDQLYSKAAWRNTLLFAFFTSSRVIVYLLGGLQEP